MKTAAIIGIVFVVVSAQIAAAQEPHRITRLKDLCIDTTIVSGGKPRAVIVAPPGGRYADTVEEIRRAVREYATLDLPVRRDAPNPEEILKEQNVIALGNMATNPFVEHMYRQWYVLLDLKYPGRGGYVVRSLHNPYATGRNVIWIGGSDDRGVGEAARVFAGLLKSGDPLKVGWLMEIRLGEGVVPPRIGDDGKGWNKSVYSWRDSWRLVDGKKTGYGPATFFGWNPISIAGVLYYMTGRKEHLDYFKAMAMPDPKNIPVPNRTDSAFNDPMNPLVKNYHYRAHLVDCVFDMIEESPLFTDEERLFITNKLLEHQDHYDPKDTYSKPNTSRHGAWHMLCIYTGSRYLGKYYPSPRWEKRMENVRKAFHGWIGNPTWGERDTLSWVSTSTEPVFEFFMLDGFKDFVGSGTARTMISAAEILWSGRKIEESNKCLTINLLHKAAYMLEDGRYIWLARQLGFDFDAFRIGQSFWPPETLEIEPPENLVGRVSYYPLPRSRWRWTGGSIPLEEGFQVLSYRAGLTDRDDFFQIDGFYGRGRNPYHVNSLYVLRMSGEPLLGGYGSQVHVRRNGMVEGKVATAAALKRAVAFTGAAYIRTQVPDMPFSSWDRHVLYIGGDYAFVLDELKAREPGIFDITCGWCLPHAPEKSEDAHRRVTTGGGVAVNCARPVKISTHGRTARQSWTGELKAGETFVLGNLIYSARGAEKRFYGVDPIAERANLIRGPVGSTALSGRRGTGNAFVSVGGFNSGALTVKGEVAHVSGEKVFLARATSLKCSGLTVVQCDTPVSVLWHLDTGELCVEAEKPSRLTLAAAGKKAFTLEPGQHELGRVAPDPGLVRAIAGSLEALRDMVEEEAPATAEAEGLEADWRPEWRAKLQGNVTHIAVASHSAPANIWVTTTDERTGVGGGKPQGFGRLSLLSSRGEILNVSEYDAVPLSLWAAADRQQAKSFAALVGFRDDMLRAFSATGDEIWKCGAAIHPSFKIGDRYEAPWFTDPRPRYKKRGVFSILVGDLWGEGKQEIVIGRPCTVEFRDLTGKLIERVATRWGDNTSLAMLKKRGREAGEERPRWLLVGKFFCGGPGVSAIGEEHKLRSNGFYCAIEKGSTSMHAWMQRGLSHLVTSDIDDDGVEEVVVALSGHWNQLNVYRSVDPGWKRCLWTRCFGPARSRSRFVRAVIVADITGDGMMEIVVGMENGWVCAFDRQGTPIWQKRFPSGVTAMCALRASGKLVVGCQDGSLHLIGAKGRVLHTAVLDASVSTVTAGDQSILAGTRSGGLARFRTGTRGHVRAERERRTRLRTPGKARPEAIVAWDERLLSLVRAAARAGAKPRFRLVSMRTTVRVEKVDDRGTLHLAAGPMALQLDLSGLSPAEKSNLALAVADERDREDCAVIGFYLLATGNEAAAERFLSAAGETAEEVRAAFE